MTCASRSKKGISFGGTSPTAPRPWSRAAWPPPPAEEEDDDGGAAALLEEARAGASARAETAPAIRSRRRRLDAFGVVVGRGANLDVVLAPFRRPATTSPSAVGAELACRSILPGASREEVSSLRRGERETTTRKKKLSIERRVEREREPSFLLRAKLGKRKKINSTAKPPS